MNFRNLEGWLPLGVTSPANFKNAQQTQFENYERNFARSRHR